MKSNRLYLRAPGERRRPPPAGAALLHLDEPGLGGFPIHHNLDQLFSYRPAEELAAFLLGTLGVWAADKFLPRRDAPDAWTRQIVLHLPGPAVSGRIVPRLEGLLHFLTGDEWTLKWRLAPVELGLEKEWPHAWQPDAVTLFSGGLDSLAGAIDLLEAGRRLVLVSHYDFGQLAGVQQALAAALVAHYGPDRLHHLPVRVQFPATQEWSLRSRSLLYLALGLTTAAAFGPGTPLTVPENGWVSLNPPLTLNRLGAYSTRTTHPYFMQELAGLLAEMGLGRPLGNPYRLATKGQVLEGCAHRDLLQRLAPLTVSCARPVVSRWRGQGGGACGYCYPCLLRRAALSRLGWDRGEDYLLDVLAAPESLVHRVRGRNLRALLYAIRTWEEDPQVIEARLWLGAAAADLAGKFSEVRPLLAAGFEEIGQFLRTKGPAWVRSFME